MATKKEQTQDLYTQENKAKQEKTQDISGLSPQYDVDKNSSHSEGVLQSKTTEESNEKQSVESAAKKEKPKNLEDFLNTLKPQEQNVLKKFMESPVYDDFMGYLEGYFKEKDTLIHRINCYCFRVKKDFNQRIQGKVYELKKGDVFYIQKDMYGTSFLKNTNVERIL